MSFARGNFRQKLATFETEAPKPSSSGGNSQTPNANDFKWRGKKLGRVATLTVDGRDIEAAYDDLHDYVKIGAGQFGTVKMCQLRKGSIKKDVASKEIQVRDVDGTSTKSITKELNILSTSINKFIVQYYGCFFYDQNIVIVMELMHYGSFDKIYNQVGKIRENIVGRIMFAIVTGLNYLHTVWNVIHRDMKPSNVLLNKAGHVKICDFGVSRPESTQPMSHVGCRNYMAPERIEPKEGVQYDFKSDVWSVGITAYELLEGQYPFEDKRGKYFELLKAITQGPTPRLSPGNTEAMQSFMELCLRKKSNDRPDYAGLLQVPFLVPFGEGDARTNLLDWIKEVKLDPITAT